VRLHRELLVPSSSNGHHLSYSDTDCAHTDANLPVGEGLGELAHEADIEDAVYLGAKLYRYRCNWCPDKDKEHPHYVVKAKGFPRLSREQFDRLTVCGCQDGYRAGTAVGCPACGGGGVGEPGDGRGRLTYDRTEGFKEALARGRVDYRRISITKGHRNISRPKRADGGARPWTVEEMGEKYVGQGGKIGAAA
jgi:hypothetical protein